jgi:hypothetical protein
MFFGSQIEMTLITIGCKTTLHHCVKYNNFQPFFKNLLIGRLYHPHSNLSTPNCFQCLLYFTSLHDLTLCLVFSYPTLFISCFQTEAFLALYALNLSLTWVLMSYTIPCSIALDFNFIWGLIVNLIH